VDISFNHFARMRCTLAGPAKEILEDKITFIMIRPLRRYHYYLWRFLALLLVAGFILAILWRPASISSPNEPESADLQLQKIQTP
jgi:hypothetical protein